MPKDKKIQNVLNPIASCKKYGLGLWQCPQFLFLIMGLIIIVVIIVTYFLTALKISNPMIVSLIVLFVGAVLMAISFVITDSFERIAEASRMKTEFIGIVSHQLRAPLTNLRFSLDFLVSGKAGGVNEQQTEYFSILKENTQRMGELIDNLLMISKIETGTFPMDRKLVSLEEITKGLIAKFKAFAQASGVKISLETSGGSFSVSADPLWLEQVVENLLDNAIRYAKHQGEVAIKIRQKNKKVHLEIKDNGVGIPKEEQKYIFEKFFRSKNALKQQTDGSGLGLHIAKKIVELLDGKIWFKSKEGEGATFYFELPIK